MRAGIVRREAQNFSFCGLPNLPFTHYPEGWKLLPFFVGTLCFCALNYSARGFNCGGRGHIRGRSMFDHSIEEFVHRVEFRNSTLFAKVSNASGVMRTTQSVWRSS